MKTLLLALPSILLLLASCNDSGNPRRLAVKNANAFIKQGDLSKASQVLKSALDADTGPIVRDTAYMLHADLGEIADPETLEEHALQIEKDKQWQAVETNSYQPTYLLLASSNTWAKAPLLKLKAKMPSILAQRKKAAAAFAVQRAKDAKENAIKEAREPLEKRIKAGELMRELYLDHSQDVKVTVTGKNKDVITLSYVLIGDVWEHRMNKEGEIDALLDLGFKKVVLTDGYDYNKVWTRGGK